jgi:acyl-CoA thioesterase II
VEQESERESDTLEDTSAETAVAMLLGILDLHSTGARTTEDIFTGDSQPMPFGRIFGGQVLAQAIVAAARTLPDDRAAHSMHGYFLRPGDASEPVTFSVDRIHDGRSFSTRRTQAYQDGVPIFSMIASFQDTNPGLEHATPPPADIPPPEDVPSFADSEGSHHPASRRLFSDSPLELRHVTGPIYARVDGGPRPEQAVWVRTRAPLPDDPAIHRAALAYISDLTIQESILRAHGLPWATPGLKIASLDHAMWWHRPGRVDDWLLYVQESPSAQSGRGLATGRIYSREGELLASSAQEIMIRVPDAD